VYAAQEDVGIWRIPLGGQAFGTPQLVDRVREYGQPAVYDEATEECAPSGPASPDAGQHLSADAEGLTIMGRTLIASSQGDSTFAKYSIETGGLVYESGFQVVDGTVDSVQDCDGAAVTTRALGNAFPHGLLVVHDGENTPGDADRPNTNFKLIRLETVR
jgi:3-phytase